MLLTFLKYQGTGNDFILVDNRSENFPKKDAKTISFLCDRRLGIGADGLILLENDSQADFRMVYFNADGNEGTLCGNGGRCIVAFANYLRIVDSEASFMAIDGMHHAKILEDKISLSMHDVSDIKEKPNAIFLDTGSPHHVQMVDQLLNFPVYKEGAKLRYGLYGKTGSNINFVEQHTANSFSARTYERGVENETLSCGTGVTAVALAMHHAGKTNENQITVHTQGGELEVKFTKSGSGYSEIYLTGPVACVFQGTIEC